MPADDRLDDLLLRWEELAEQGRGVPPEELCRDCPELGPALLNKIAALKGMGWADAPDPPEAPPSPPGGTPSSTPPRMLAGRYRLEELLGEGGFGRVWRAFDQELQRLVAVKVPKQIRPDRHQERGFLAEARKVARLKHACIVPVYDVGQHGQSYFIVSEMIDGEDLSKRMGRGRLPVREAVRIVAAVADALEYSHRQHIIHRDIKPSNILIDRHGEVHLTDFGIALDGNGGTDREGEVCGTLAYMSPEQLGGSRPIDGRSDIYSLGVMLGELVGGVHPAPPFDTVKVRGPHPSHPIALGGTLPSALERVWRRCVAREPADRYASAKELADDLQKALTVLVKEEVWAACTDPMRMLGPLRLYASPRKIRLFVCGCVRQQFPRLDDERSRRAVDVAERHADDQATNEELGAARTAAWEAREELRTHYYPVGRGTVEETRHGLQTAQAAACAWTTSEDVWSAAFNAARHTEPSLQCRLLRELFGPSPYSPRIPDPSWLAWNGRLVHRLAMVIYQEGAWDRMPILADALEEAGCSNEEILNHCRSEEPHVRGCFVLDLLLGKE